MLMFDEEGNYKCQDCDYKTDDVFDLLFHCQLDFNWVIRLSSRYSLDLFLVLQAIKDMNESGDKDGVHELVEAIALALVNASEGNFTFNKFLHETIVRSNAESIIHGLEEMLKDEKEER